jgi:D-apiose dehydrogenase
MKRKTRVAVIGCGFFAQNHLHAWRDLAAEGVELVGVCDHDETKATAASKTFATSCFTSVTKMLDAEKPDLVDVITRMDTHVELCADLAERRIAAIVQKPLAPTWANCLTMAENAKRHDSFLAVHENFRFQTPMLKLKSLLEQGAIGDVTWSRLAFRTGFDVFGNQPYLLNEERLVILDVGIHVLDIARVFLGEATHVSCEIQKRNPRVRADDTATMLLRHSNGAVSIVESTYMAKRHPDPFPYTRVEIEGSRGALILESDDRIILSDGTQSRVIEVNNPLAPWMARPWHVVQQSVLETNRQILASYRKGEKAATDISDNLKTFSLVEAAYASAAQGKTEAVSNWRS